MLSKISRFLLVLIALGILVLSLLPKPPLNDVFKLKSLDHFLAYSVLGFFVFLSIYIKGSYFPPFLKALIYCTIYGGAIELLQKYTGRKPEIFDFLMDGAGAACGALLGIGADLLIRKRAGR